MLNMMLAIVIVISPGLPLIYTPDEERTSRKIAKTDDREKDRSKKMKKKNMRDTASLF